MRKFKRRQPHSFPFRFLLFSAGALLLLTALAPRANAGPTDYWNFEDPLGSRPKPAPELFSQPQGVPINQPLASNYNPNLVLNVAPGEQTGGFQPQQVDANFSWTGATNTIWSLPGNWSPSVGAPPGGMDTALFNSAFSNQPNITANTALGELIMTDGVAQNVTLSSSLGAILTINGAGTVTATGVLIDNTNAFTLTITARVALGNFQAWTNNSSNLFTVSSPLGLNLNTNNLTVNGTGDTLISANITGNGATSVLIKDGTGTLTITGTNTYSGDTTVNGGTLLVNGSTANHPLTVNNTGTLGGTGTVGGTVQVNAGGNLSPGNGGNNTAILNTGSLTLAPASNFRIDINGTTVGTGYDQLQSNAGTVTITGSVLVVTVGTTLSVGQTFTILSKTTGAPASGTFLGIPQLGTVTGSNGTVFRVNYTGGDGNDIVLTVVTAAPVPEPSTWIGGALAIAGLAFTQRRRLRKLITRRCAVGSS